MIVKLSFCCLIASSFDEGGPVSFAEHRSRLMSALEAAAWPMDEADILLLEREIEQAELYIQQARDLIAQRKQPEPKVSGTPRFSKMCPYLHSNSRSAFMPRFDAAKRWKLTVVAL